MMNQLLKIKVWALATALLTQTAVLYDLESGTNYRASTASTYGSFTHNTACIDTHSLQ